MNYIKIFSILIILFSHLNLYAEEPLKVSENISVSVSSISVDNSNVVYKKGDNIHGNFFVTNLSKEDVFGLKYTISLVGSYNKDMGYYEKDYDTETFSNFYLFGLEKKEIEFNYKIPAINIGGDFALKIRFFTKAGIPLSTSFIKIKIDELPSSLKIDNSHIRIDNNIFLLQNGPSIRDDRRGFLNFTLSNPFGYTIKVRPQIKIYDRTISGDLLKTINIDEFDIKSNESIKKEIEFTNFIKKAGVYEGVLTLFNVSGEQISEKILFRYIVYGNIVTIQNISIDKKEVIKGESFNLNISYTGAPYDLNTNEFPEQPPMNTEIILSDYFGRKISKNSVVIDYSKNTNVVIPFIADKTSKFLNVDIKVYDRDNNVITNYTNNIGDIDKYNRYFNIFWIVFSLVVFCILLYLIPLIIKSKKSKILLFIIISFLSFNIKDTFASDPYNFIYKTGVIGGLPSLKDMNFYRTDGSSIENYGTFTRDGLIFNTIKVSPGEKFTINSSAILEGCINTKMVQVDFNDVGVTGSLQHSYRNSMYGFGVFPDGSGDGTFIIGNDNLLASNFVDYLTAPSNTGSYNIMLSISTWDYDPEGGEINNSNVIGYIVVDVVENGICGTANEKIYSSSVSSYGSDTQCLSGNSSNTSFPSVGSTTSWTCLGKNGGVNSGICSASRESGPFVNLEVLTPVVLAGPSSYGYFSWNTSGVVNCKINSISTVLSTTSHKRGPYTSVNNSAYPNGIRGYTLLCNTSSGLSLSDYVELRVVDNIQPTLTLEGPDSVLSGESPTIGWNATNVKSCTKSGGWNSAVNIINNSSSGTENPGPITTNTTYDMSCIGLNDSNISQSKTVAVIQCVQTSECTSSWSECIDGERRRDCEVTYNPSGCGIDYSYEETEYCNIGLEILPLNITCQAYQNFGSGYREASTGTIYVNRDMEWRLFINDPNTGNTSYSIYSPQGELQEGGSYYYLSKLYQNSGLKIFNAKVIGSPFGGEGACATSVNAVIGGQIVIEE